jgi:hypothetical protein
MDTRFSIMLRKKFNHEIHIGYWVHVPKNAYSALRRGRELLADFFLIQKKNSSFSTFFSTRKAVCANINIQEKDNYVEWYYFFGCQS